MTASKSAQIRSSISWSSLMSALMTFRSSSLLSRMAACSIGSTAGSRGRITPARRRLIVRRMSASVSFGPRSQGSGGIGTASNRLPISATRAWISFQNPAFSSNSVVMSFTFTHLHAREKRRGGVEGGRSPPITLGLLGHGDIMLGHHPAAGRLRYRSGRLRSGLRLLPALEASEALDFLYVRQQDGMGRVASQLRGDAIGLAADERNALAANEIRSSDTVERHLQLSLGPRPPVAPIHQLTPLPGRVAE